MTNQKLRELCIENNWFTSGDNEQYAKLFDYNYSGAFISQLACMIWICSPYAELEDITRKLEEAEEEHQKIREACENEQ